MQAIYNTTANDVRIRSLGCTIRFDEPYRNSRITDYQIKNNPELKALLRTGTISITNEDVPIILETLIAYNNNLPEVLYSDEDILNGIVE